MKTYEYDGVQYHLHYSLERLEQMEAAAGSVMTIFAAYQQQKMPTVRQILTMFAYGLLGENGVWMPLKQALKFAQQQLETTGYAAMLSAVIEQLMEDCGFLFQGD